MSTAGLDAAFTALADPTRRGVVTLLLSRPRRAGEISRALRMRAPAMSRHLRVLRLAGLVAEERGETDARVRLFRLRPEPFTALRGWLDEVERYWQAQLAAFKDHAESSSRSPARARPDLPRRRRGRRK